MAVEAAEAKKTEEEEEDEIRRRNKNSTEKRAEVKESMMLVTPWVNTRRSPRFFCSQSENNLGTL